MKECGVNWFQNLNKMEDDRIPYKLLHDYPTERRVLGCPDEQWKVQFDLIEVEAGTGQ
jgi:hypothetical protein